MSGSETHRLKSALSPAKVLLPLALGIAVAWWMLDASWDDPVRDPATGDETTTRALLAQFTWSPRASWALIGAVACVLVRDFAYMVRLRILGLGRLNWRSAFSSIVLWEFASALTPSVVGGSAVAILILKREGLPVGRSVATVFVTALMDELFYLIAVPIVAVAVALTGGAFFPVTSGDWPVEPLFFVGYGFIAVLTTLIVLGVLVAPRAVDRRLNRWFGWRPLRRWQPRIEAWTADLVIASDAMRGQGMRLWVRAMGATVASWSARYLTLNCLLLVFFETVPHAAVFGRQLVMWIILMISPTPGSAGFAEVALPAFLGDVTGLAYLAVVAVLWRLFTYFPYLFAGALVLPSWLARTRRKG